MNQTKRTILIIRNAYAHDFGGGERFPVDLAKELDSLDYQTIVVSRSQKLLDYARAQKVSHERGWWLALQDWGGWRVVLLPFYFVWQLVLTVWYLNLIARLQADVVHLQSRDDFIAGTVAGRLLRKRVVWTDHADLKYVYANHKVWYKNPIGKVVYGLSKLAHAVTLVSHNEQKHIQESLGHKTPGNYAVAYMGAPDRQVTPVKRHLDDGSAVIFGATSRLVTAKGIGKLIEAFQQLNRPDTRLWLFGEGPEEEKFKEQAGDDDRIIFWGFPEDSFDRLAACDVFVHPSYHEGFSLSLIEAAMLGLPIIACKVGGNPELVEPGKNGLLVPARDAKALAKAMRELADNPAKRDDYGHAGRQIYEENFIFENAVKERFLPLYV